MVLRKVSEDGVGGEADFRHAYEAKYGWVGGRGIGGKADNDGERVCSDGDEGPNSVGCRLGIPGEALERRDCWSGLIPEQNKGSDGHRWWKIRRWPQELTWDKSCEWRAPQWLYPLHDLALYCRWGREYRDELWQGRVAEFPENFRAFVTILGGGADKAPERGFNLASGRIGVAGLQGECSDACKRDTERENYEQISLLVHGTIFGLRGRSINSELRIAWALHPPAHHSEHDPFRRSGVPRSSKGADRPA
jgi:hypothetical protein